MAARSRSMVVSCEREQGLAILSRVLQDVERSGAGRLVFVAGEAGVGKTALVRRFCEQARGLRVLWSGCDPLATPAPLGSVVEVAQQLAGSAAALVVGGARPHDVARALLDDLARAPSAVLVLEDLHWADEGTVDVLGCVVRRVERVPALVICTYRDDELEAAHPLRVMLGRVATATSVERLRLERLSETAVGVLAAARRIGSSYCTVAHGSVLIDKFLEPDTVRALVDDDWAADLDPCDLAVMVLADNRASRHLRHPARYRPTANPRTDGRRDPRRGAHSGSAMLSSARRSTLRVPSPTRNIPRLNPACETH